MYPVRQWVMMPLLATLLLFDALHDNHDHNYSIDLVTTAMMLLLAHWQFLRVALMVDGTSIYFP